MFFKNYLIFIFFKFLWAGLIFGLIRIVFNWINRVTRDNVYIYNFISFVYWLSFGIYFILLCFNFYDYSFCWFGLIGMFVGLFLVRVSLDFLLTNLLLILYYKFGKKSLRKKQNNELQSDEKN